MRLSPKTALLAACFWILLCLFSIDADFAKLHALHALGQHASPARYLILCFWVIVLGFWIVLGWKSFKRLQAERKVL